MKKARREINQHTNLKSKQIDANKIRDDSGEHTGGSEAK